jgi:hypothetical protein
MYRGYLALWRKIEDHPFYKERREFSKLEAWIDILMQAQHDSEQTDVVLGMTVLKCNYGECLKSVMTWARRWRWSESKVRRFFKLLEKMNQITQKSEGKTTRITVINYYRYDPKRRANDAYPTDKRRANDEQTTTDKHYNIQTLKNAKKKIPKKKSQAEKPDSVSESVWSDFLTLRKVKKAPLTESALSGIQKQAEKAGWSLENALIECNSRGWAGFKADWVDKPGVNGNRQMTRSERNAAECQAFIDEMDRENLTGH